MSKKLFQRLERYRKKHKLSILAVCRELETSHVNYHRWKNAGEITGPYKKIIESFLGTHQSESESASNLSKKTITNNQEKSADIAVIGMACCYPGAQTVKELWENILARRIQFRRILDQRLPLADYYAEDARGETSYLTKAAFIDGFDFDWSKWRIPKKVFESTDIVHWLALDTALHAFEDAGYKDGKNIPFEKTGVLVGNTLTGEQARSQSLRLRWPFVRKALEKTLHGFDVPVDERQKFARVMEEIYKSAFYPITEDSLAGGLSNTIAGRICNYFKLNGGGYVVDGACASSLLAVATAVNALKSGDMDLALAGGVDVSLDPFELVGFSKAGALAKDQMRVYDRRGAGFLPGEGCGFVVLKRLADARRDGDDIYAVIKGCGISSDGKGGIMEPSSEGQSLAIRRAYNEVGYTPAQLDFVEGHGTGTARGDEAELGGIALAIEGSGAGELIRSCGVTSFKSVVGHTKAAAGIGGLLKAIAAVNQRILPPVANCYEPHAIFEGGAKSLYPVIQGHVFDKARKVRAGVSAAGFGGINCHVTLESCDKPSDKIAPSMDERALLVSAQQIEVFVFSCQTTGHLIRAITKFKEKIRFISQAEMADFACWLNTQPRKRAPVRAAVVTDTPEHLYEALYAIEQFIADHPVEPGTRCMIPSKQVNTRILISNGIKDCRVGFLYPGQASQKLNMTRHLFERYGWAREFARHLELPIEKFLYQPLDRLITESERQKARDDLNQVHVTQAAVALSSAIWTEFLSRLGLEPDAVAGHSLGELAAFYKAGAYDAATFLKFAEFRGRVMSPEGSLSAFGGGGMLSVFCSLKDAQDLIKDIQGVITVANINTPKQIVISGEKKAVQQAAQRAREKNIRCVDLPVSNAFHSPLMEHASQKTARYELIKKIFTPKDIRVFSGVPDEVIDGPVDLQKYFSKQVISRVDFVSLVHKIRKECDVLVEVGHGRILSGLVRQIDAGTECFSVETTPENDLDLNILCAEMFIRGKALRFEQLYEGRLIRPFVPVARKKFIINQCERPLKDFARVQSGLSGKIQDAVFEDHADAAADASFEDLQVGAQTRVDQILVDQVCAMTGFEKGSISMDLRLLDDLNLDSIKAAELIGKTTQALGVAGEIDPSQHSNKTLAEIAGVLEGLIKERSSGLAEGGQAGFDFQRYANKGWVRNFVVDYVERPLDKKTASSGLAVQSARIFCDRDEPLVAALEKKIPLAKKDADYVIHILPRPRKTGELSVEDLKTAVECFHQTVETALSGKKKPESVVFVQFGGGFFGETGGIVDPVSSCARALASTLHLEHPDLIVKVLDFDASLEAERISAAVIDELKINDRFSAVGYDKNFIRREGIFKLSDPVDYKKRKITWSVKDVVLVTGGAKGITAQCAFEFARFFKARMILIGRSDKPKISDKDNPINSALQRFEDEGLQAHYFSCDMTDEQAVQQLFKKIRKQYGPVTGVIHGAGLNTLRRLKGSDAAAVVIECLPKVMGARNIFKAVDRDRLKMFAALTSVIGVTGMEGSGWYGFANELLNLEIKNFKQKNKDIETGAIAYSVWDETGMGVDLGTIDWLAKRGIGAISVHEGVKRFRNLLEFNSGSQQTIVVARTAGLDTWKVDTLEPQKFRFIEDVKYDLPGVELIARARLNTQDDVYVLDHNWKGSLLFPLVFGLEAMAQGYAHVLGEDVQGRLQFNDVKLERPIPVDEQHGTGIEIHVQMLERKDKKDPPKAEVEIYCEQTGYREPHFSAIVSVAPERAKKNLPKKVLDAAGQTIDIDMKTDIYGPILFQGGPFQCIEKLHQLYYDDKTREGECVFTSFYNRFAPDFLEKHPSFGSRFLTGDPFFLDSLLQSMQLIIPQDESLPDHIGEVVIDIDSPKNIQSVNGKADIFKIDNEQGIGNVNVFGEGTTNFSVKGFHLRIFKTIQERFSANELADPDKRVQRKIDEMLAELKREGRFIVPVIRCLHDSRLIKASKSLRHEIEKVLVQATVNKLLVQEERTTVKDVRLKWHTDGKPVLENKELQGVGISLSHDGNLLVCVAGFGEQGIDVETVSERSRSEWRALLGNKKYDLVKKNIELEENINYMGTVIWSANEAFIKYLTKEESVNFVDKKNGRYYVLQCGEVFTISMLVNVKGEIRVLSFLVRDEYKKAKEGILENLGYKKDCFDFNVEYTGPQKQLVTVKRFPTSFKVNKLRSRRVYFTSFLEWMGEMRELSILPIYNKLADVFETGEWGISTNNLILDVKGEIRSSDNVEVRFWLDKKISRNIFDLAFEFRILTSNNEIERVALATQRISWIKVLEHGKARVDDAPQFFNDLMDLMLPIAEKKEKLPHLEEAYSQLKLNDVMLDYDSLKKKAPLLLEMKIETSLDDSNLVGNIYFSNYATWVARATEKFFYSHWPEIYSGTMVRKEMICLKFKIDYLNEAMPFDNMLIKMYLAKLFKNGFIFKYEFYASDSKKKIASAEQTVLLVSRDARMKPISSDLTESQVARLKKFL